METKDIILIILAIVGTITGIAGLIFGIYQYRKSRRLEKEKFDYQNEKGDRQLSAWTP